MRYNRLGSTGLLVSELCFGTMTFGGRGEVWGQIGRLGQGEADALVGRALEAGVNFFDTADQYSEGESERILGKALGKRRGEVVIATKVYGAMGPGPNDRGLSRAHVVRAADDSLRRLGTDWIDLYQVQAFDPLTPLEETLSALDDLVRAGKVRYVGCSNFAAWQLAKALGLSERRGWERFESLQTYYSLAGRGLERELVPLLRDQRVGLMVWSPLAGGILTGKFSRESEGPAGARRTGFDFPPVDRGRVFDIVDVAREVAEDHEATVPQVALAWLLRKPFVTSVILGVKRLEQLEDNLGAAELDLADEDAERLDGVSALPPEYPGWMLEFQGGDREGQVAEVR